MTVAPGREFGAGAEGQDEGAVLMHVIPGARGRDGEVDPDVVQTEGLTLGNGDSERLVFTAVASMDADVAARESGDPEGAPDTGRPPAAAAGFNPVHGGGKRKGMDYPRLGNVGVKDDAMDGSELAQGSIDFGGSEVEGLREVGVVGARALVEDSADDQMVEFGKERVAGVHLFIVQRRWRALGVRKWD